LVGGNCRTGLDDLGEKNLPLAGIRIPGLSARSLVTKLTELSKLRLYGGSNHIKEVQGFNFKLVKGYLDESTW
jgi:hypothetical protein